MGDEKLLREMGARISARRKELHLTQEALAEKMDVSLQMISNLELGKKAIRPENLVKLCQVLSVSADYILRGVQSEVAISAFLDKCQKLPYEKQRLLEIIVESWE
ncbi:MAG: helix-turn-helix transcriptional regulator [Clostridia bacterium]|nr:helix-turn-helix transcriptional regulator [Clostridia bacterium]